MTKNGLYTWGCIKWDSIFWDRLSLIGATREILGNPYKLGQYKNLSRTVGRLIPHKYYCLKFILKIVFFDIFTWCQNLQVLLLAHLRECCALIGWPSNGKSGHFRNISFRPPQWSTLVETPSIKLAKNQVKIILKIDSPRDVFNN